MDRIAERLAVDPVRLRAMNALRPGDTTATGQVLGKDTSALAVLRQAVRRSGFARKRKAWRGTDRGIGLSLFFHGAGFTGGGEVKLDSEAALELTETGVRILVASTEIGQGTRTMHAQIVADTLGLPYERVEVGTRRYRPGPRQRADGGLPHLHGGGQDPAALRPGDEAAPARDIARRRIFGAMARW
jgi:CO/xanthine dehydrogenase Mo-binding subunit